MSHLCKKCSCTIPEDAENQRICQTCIDNVPAWKIRLVGLGCLIPSLLFLALFVASVIGNIADLASGDFQMPSGGGAKGAFMLIGVVVFLLFLLAVGVLGSIFSIYLLITGDRPRKTDPDNPAASKD